MPPHVAGAPFSLAAAPEIPPESELRGRAAACWYDSVVIQHALRPRDGPVRAPHRIQLNARAARRHIGNAAAGF
jgi:hypothetical protein